MATVTETPPAVGDAEWAARLDGFVQRAQEASAALRELDQKAVDRAKLDAMLERHGLTSQWEQFERRYLEDANG